MPKYNSAENEKKVQQCRKLIVFGTVEYFFILGTLVLRDCCTAPFFSKFLWHSSSCVNEINIHCVGLRQFLKKISAGTPEQSFEQKISGFRSLTDNRTQLISFI